MSASGGDGGASKRQAEEEARKQAARDQLNVLFGEAPTAAPTVNRDDFYRAPAAPQISQGRASFGAGASSPTLSRLGATQTKNAPGAYFDQAAYDAAVASANSVSAAEAAKNKTGRESLYADIRNNAFTAGKRGIDEQTGDAKRNLKFELFAKGLNGGSTDIDQNARLQRTYDSGILNLGAKADGAAADVRGNDEATRLGLLQSIDAGLDQGSAISSALAQMQTNSAKAASGAAQTTIDDLFGNAGLLYQNSRRALGEADARDAALYGAGGGRKPKAYTGTITGI